MSIIPLKESQVRLSDLINEVSQPHEPILISGTTSNAFLVSQEDWKGIQETIYLLSIPEVKASIVEDWHWFRTMEKSSEIIFVSGSRRFDLKMTKTIVKQWF